MERPGDRLSEVLPVPGGVKSIRYFPRRLRVQKRFPAQCAPLSFFRLAERKIAPRPVEERKGAKRGQHCAVFEPVRADIERRAGLVQGPCRIATPSAVLPGSQTVSRGKERGGIPVRSTIERQRNAGAPPTPHCSSGDPGSSLGLPAFAWSPEDTSSGRLSWIRRKPLPVADAGAAPDPQPRLWRAVAKQARRRHCGKAEEPFLSARGKKWVLISASRSRRTRKYLEINLYFFHKELYPLYLYYFCLIPGFNCHSIC